MTDAKLLLLQSKMFESINCEKKKKWAGLV